MHWREDLRLERRRRHRAMILWCAHPPLKSRSKICRSILTLLKPGMRLAVGLSGGADSVALLRALAARSAELGLVLHAAHLHHGLRGAEADGDLEFCPRAGGGAGPAAFTKRAWTLPPRRGPMPKPASRRETIEEAARRLRYAWFRQLCPRAVHAWSMQSRRRTRSTTRRRRFSRSFCAGRGRKACAGIASKARNPGGARLCGRCWPRRAPRLRRIWANWARIGARTSRIAN